MTPPEVFHIDVTELAAARFKASGWLLDIPAAKRCPCNGCWRRSWCRESCYLYKAYLEGRKPVIPK